MALTFVADSGFKRHSDAKQARNSLINCVSVIEGSDRSATAGEQRLVEISPPAGSSGLIDAAQLHSLGPLAGDRIDLGTGKPP